MSRTNKVASFFFRGSFPDGEVFDERLETPYRIRLGAAQVMKPIDQALMEMEIGEERTLFIGAEDAYGAYAREAVQKVAASAIPDGENVPVGEMIWWRHPNSPDPVPVKVVSFEDGIIELDFNHPLAGKDLVYWIKLVEIESD